MVSLTKRFGGSPVRVNLSARNRAQGRTGNRWRPGSVNVTSASPHPRSRRTTGSGSSLKRASPCKTVKAGLAVQDAFRIGVRSSNRQRACPAGPAVFACGNRRHVDAIPARRTDFPGQNGQIMGSADHGSWNWHKQPILNAGAACAGSNQRDRRALLDGLQRRAIRGPAAANDGDMQPRPQVHPRIFGSML